ncbi:hypothetical protein GC177_03530 [bacterium]|nr:hypothetical protein [bacterium]
MLTRALLISTLLASVALIAQAAEHQMNTEDQQRTLPMQRLLKDTPNGTTVHDDCMRRYWDNKILYNQCLKGQQSFLQFVIPGKQEWLEPASERQQ